MENRSRTDQNGNINCYNCTNCYGSVDCNNCSNCHGSVRCQNCISCDGCIDCTGCRNLAGAIGNHCSRSGKRAMLTEKSALDTVLKLENVDVSQTNTEVNDTIKGYYQYNNMVAL